MGGGIVILFAVGEPSLLEAQRQRGQPLPDDFNAFLRIGEDGRVSCFTGKIEMGQGVITSPAMMLADELEVPLDSVDMVMGDTDLCPWDAGTWGSMSTRFFGPPLRAAAAGIDPLEFRLKNLKDARMIRVLKAAAEKFGWTPAKAPSGRGGKAAHHGEFRAPSFRNLMISSPSGPSAT
jgi:CO/xanthine dehydrogenase Mo-binding subunit